MNLPDRGTTMATHTEIEKLEQELIDARNTAEDAIKLLSEETIGRVGCLKENMDHWGTMSVNAFVLAKKCEALCKAIDAARGVKDTM